MPQTGTIGVCGIGENVGTTHLSIAICNFLSGKFCKNTAYLEMNASHEIYALAGRSDGERTFSLKKVDYHPAMTIASAHKILQKSYRYSVLDFGVPNDYTMQEFSGCDRRLIVGPASPWKRARLQKFIRTFPLNNNKEETIYIGNTMGAERDLRQLGQLMGMRAVVMPFIPDPFKITPEVFGFLQDILR